MSDEEIIKKRLLIDGDGTGDDRRLNMLLKQFLKWTFSKNDSPENNQIIHDRLLAQLAQCQFATSKSEFTSTMIDQELKNYAKLSESIEQSIELAKNEIEESKRELVLAKQIRKNKMEYDMLAKLIKEQPDRKETTKQIETVKKEFNDLIEKKIKLERKFQKRRNDFTLLMYSIRELQSQLEEDSSSDSSKSDAYDDDVEVVGSARRGSTGGIGGLAEMMELSDDDAPSTSSRAAAGNVHHPTQSSESEIKIESGSLVGEEGEETSKTAVSVDEEAVLELSIDKDENDVVKLEEAATAAT